MASWRWLVTAANVLFCSLAGYGLAKFRFPMRDFCFRTILCTLMLPLEIVLVPTFLVVQQLGMVNSLAGIIVPLAVDAFGIFPDAPVHQGPAGFVDRSGAARRLQ